MILFKGHLSFKRQFFHFYCYYHGVLVGFLQTFVNQGNLQGISNCLSQSGERILKILLPKFFKEVLQMHDFFLVYKNG